MDYHNYFMNPEVPHFGYSTIFAKRFSRYVLLLETLGSNELLTAISEFLEVHQIIALASSCKKYHSILQIQSIQLRILRAKVAWMQKSSSKPTFYFDMIASISFQKQSIDPSLQEFSSKKLAHDYQELKKFNEKLRAPKKLKNSQQQPVTYHPTRNINNHITSQSSLAQIQPKKQVQAPINGSGVQPRSQTQKEKSRLRYKPEYIQILMQTEAKADYVKRLETEMKKIRAKQELMQTEIQEEERLRKLRKLAKNDDRYQQLLKEEEILPSQLQLRQKKRIQKLKMKKSPKPQQIMKVLKPQISEENEIVSTEWIDNQMNKNKVKLPIYGLKQGQTLIVYKESLISRVATYFGFDL